MKAQKNPPRLVESSEFSDVLSKASQRTWSEAHSNKQRKAIAAGVAALAAGGVAASTASALSLTTLLKLSILILALGTASTGLYLAIDDQSTDAPAILVTTPDASPLAMIQLDAAVQAADAGLASHPSKSGKEPSKPMRRASKATRKLKPTQNTPQIVSKQTTLSAQLELIRSAKAAASRSDHKSALQHIGLLSSRYPQGHLFMEAQLLALEYLAILGRDVEGLRLVKKLLAKRIPVGKKAQLLRLQGDLFLKRGDCTSASEAFQRAIGYGLTKTGNVLAQRGLEKCVPR